MFCWFAEPVRSFFFVSLFVCVFVSSCCWFVWDPCRVGFGRYRTVPVILDAGIYDHLGNTAKLPIRNHPRCATEHSVTTVPPGAQRPSSPGAETLGVDCRFRFVCLFQIHRPAARPCHSPQRSRHDRQLGVLRHVPFNPVSSPSITRLFAIIGFKIRFISSQFISLVQATTRLSANSWQQQWRCSASLCCFKCDSATIVGGMLCCDSFRRTAMCVREQLA